MQGDSSSGQPPDTRRSNGQRQGREYAGDIVSADDCDLSSLVPPRLGDPSPPDLTRSLLTSLQNTVIPRLMKARMPPPAARGQRPAARSVDEEDVLTMSRLILDDDIGAARDFITSLRDDHVSVESVYLDLLTGVARHLGKLWEEDLCDFVRVTIGTGRLKQLVYELSGELEAPSQPTPGLRQVMLVAVPGSQHTLGLLIVSEFFRQAGWEVWSVPTLSMGDLKRTLSNRWFDVVGFSVGSAAQIPTLIEAIAAVRQGSQNPSVKVMVGGPCLVVDPSLSQQFAADITAVDAPQALRAAEALVKARG